MPVTLTLNRGRKRPRSSCTDERVFIDLVTAHMKKIAIQIIIFSLLIISQSAYGAHSILLVIDMQKGLLDTNSSMHVQNSMVDGVVKNVNENIAVARQKNIPIIYIRNEWSNFIWNYLREMFVKKGVSRPN